MKTVVVFAGNRYPKNQEKYYLDLAYQTGKLLALNNFSVATGAGFGLMDMVLKGALEAGGRTTGVALNIEGRKHSSYAQEIFVFDDLVDRQQKLINVGDAFIALPGGIGTFHEICDVILRKKLKLISTEKKLILVGEYFKDFARILNRFAEEGFSNVPIENFFHLVDKLPEALSLIKD